MRVLLATSPEKGHLNPMVGVAQWLLRDGRDVGWLCLPEAPPALSALGVQALSLPLPRPAAAPVTSGEALARLVLDAAALRAWIRALLLDSVPEQVEPVRAVIREFRPDVVATDGMLYPVVIAAQLEGVPFAGVSSALTLLEPPDLDFELIRTVRELAPVRDALFARYGMRASFRTCECLSPRCNVVFATDALVGSHASVPPQTWLVGPSQPHGSRGDEPPFPWHRLRHDRPIVYVSFGSQISWQPELFACIAAAAAPLDVQLVLAAGGLAHDDFVQSLPGDVIAVDYAPQLGLLLRASVFVSHGGANSVMEAMRAGVPLLLLPMCNDQPVQAHFVTRAGAGLVLDPRTLDIEGCRAALHRLLAGNSAERAGARAVQAAYEKRDGAREAAALIAALA